MFDFNNTDKVFNNVTNGGAFLVAGKSPNVMTISWGMTGVLWGKKLFLVPVRESRYTKTKLDESGEFTVSVPYNKLGKELAFCGSHSGRDCNKFQETDLMTVKAKAVDTYVVNGCDYYFECSVLAKVPLTDEFLQLFPKLYTVKDLHTLYFGKILTEYGK
ncbi:MAG: flavin reductase family protein [Clostridiales bacterium]|jgi:flavin reductase (DIM6/NTAB) family NADH-FMN oxidoreductase RutF|nr:flavin reductase family protein [Clostridiales bacterium]